jgi:hypothetical protein
MALSPQQPGGSRFRRAGESPAALEVPLMTTEPHPLARPAWSHFPTGWTARVRFFEKVGWTVGASAVAAPPSRSSARCATTSAFPGFCSLTRGSHSNAS